jgi:signal transduction histidine kinase
VDRARELIRAEASALCLWDHEKRWWVVQGTSGATDAFEISLAQFERGNGHGVQCPVIRFKYRQAHLDLPLTHNGEIVGCLCVANQMPREYSEDERALLAGIANQAALAVERTRLLETMGSRAATEERERLAREIHDTLAQILGFVNIKTGVARELLAQGKVEQAQVQLDQLSLLSQELYQDTRELILGLHADVAPEHGLVPALSSYTERFSQFCNLPATFDAQEMNMQFSPAVEVQLIRVVQEALSNVRKHAHARHAWVRLTREDNRVGLEIRDDGQGFDPKQPGRGLGPRFGLQSMRERVESIHGTFAVRSIPGQGTIVRVEVPIIYRGEEL